MLVLCPRSELNEHLDSIDSGLENLQAIFNVQSINFDSSPLFDVSVLLLPSDIMCYCCHVSDFTVLSLDPKSIIRHVRTDRIAPRFTAGGLFMLTKAALRIRGRCV